jgi:uncharacterized protein
MFEFNAHQNQIEEICVRNKVKRLVVFGSALTEDFGKSSDIDILLELETVENGLIRYMNVKMELEELFQRPVDVLMPKAIGNRYMKANIYSNTRELYAA